MHSEFPLTLELLLATAACFFSAWGSAFFLQLHCTVRLTPYPSQAVVLQSLHWATARETSKDVVQVKKGLFSKNTQHNRAGSAKEMLEHVAGADGTPLLAGIS